MAPPICLVIDVSNVACRAYYSVATGKDGRSVIGLARHRLNQMLQTLLRDTDPLRFVAALDSGRCFRHELYAPYKAHRGEKPEELRQLLLEAPELFRKAGAELLTSPGFEADDVIAAVADANLGAGWRSLLVSNDADLLQLAFDGGDTSGTFVLHQDKGMYHALGPAQVQAKLGVPPHRVALLKSLKGDSSDAIPGIPGIGPVAAKRLAGQYPSVVKVYAALHLLQKSDRQKLETAGLEYALLMETLTTLRFDAPLTAA